MSRHRRERSAGQAGKWSSIKKDTTAFAVFVMKNCCIVAQNERHVDLCTPRMQAPLGVKFFDFGCLRL